MDRTTRTYDLSRIGLHWLGAALVLVLFATAWLREGMEDPQLRRMMLDTHRLVGLCLMLFSALRLVLRLRARPVAPAPGLAGWQVVLAGLVHAGLYVMLFLQPLSGWALTSARGRGMDLFGVFTLPSLVAKSAVQAEWLGALHEYLSWLLLILVGLHVAAALFHALVLKDGVLSRMLPTAVAFSRPLQEAEE